MTQPVRLALHPPAGPPLPTESQAGGPQGGHPLGPRGPRPLLQRGPPTSPQAALPDSLPVRFTFGGGSSVSLPLPPEPSVKAIPLGSLATVSQKQLSGLSDAQALHGSEQAAGLGATELSRACSPQ